RHDAVTAVRTQGRSKPLRWRAPPRHDDDSLERDCEALARAVAASDAPVWLVTRAAMADAPDVRAAALWGLGRALALAHPGRFAGMIDLPHDVDDERDA